MVKVTGQACAAVTTAAVGSFLGGAGGTVAGAGLAAVVTTVGDAVYQRSIEHTREQVRRRLRVRREVGGPGARHRDDPEDDAMFAVPTAGPSGADDDPTVVLSPDDPPRGGRERGTHVLPGDEVATAVHGGGGPPDDPDDHRPHPWRRYGVLVATALLVFLIAMLAITGIERIKGSPLSGGTSGTSVGSVFGSAEPTTSRSAPETTSNAPTSESPTTTEAPSSTTVPGSSVTTPPPASRLVPSGLLPGG